MYIFVEWLQVTSTHSFLVEGLQLLVTFLADEDPVLISNAQLALRQLLNTKPGQLALADMEAAQRAEAVVFTPSKPMTSTPVHHSGYASSILNNPPVHAQQSFSLPQDVLQQRTVAGMRRNKGCWYSALSSAVPELTGVMQEEHRGGRALAAARQELRAVAMPAGRCAAGPVQRPAADCAAEGRPQATRNDGAHHAPAVCQPGTAGLPRWQ